MANMTTYNRATGRFDNYDEFYASSINGAIDQSIVLGKDIFLKEIRLHLSASAATAENLTISLSNTNTKLNFKLVTQAMSGVQDVRWVAENDEGLFVDASSSVVISYTNTDGRAWGLSVALTRAN